MFEQIPPSSALFLGALILPLLPRAWRGPVFLLFPALALVMILSLPHHLTVSVGFLDLTLIPLYVDRLNLLFGAVFAIIGIAGGVFALHLKDTGQQVAALLYAGGILGGAFAGDLLTLFVFFEIMVVSSTYLIWARRDNESRAAGMRYLIVHLFGGSFFLAGVLQYVASGAPLAITSLTDFMNPATWCIFGGIALNAAVPPLNAWLADAYPRATATGAVFLNAFTSKLSVYLLARMFPGLEVLIGIGLVMTFFGVIYAILSNDIRGILSYHIISQLGFMISGVGVGTEMAINGSVALAHGNILYKSLLFMGAGMVLEMTGRTKLTELGGLYRSMPVVFWLFMVGAFSISGLPPFHGFISKTMLVVSTGEAGYPMVEKLLHLGSVGTFLSISLKLAYGTWFGARKEITVSQAPWNMYLGMGVLASLCLLFGVFPGLLYESLPYRVEYVPYTIPHLVEISEITLLTFVAFWLLRSKLEPKNALLLDTDWFYRRPARWGHRVIVDGIGGLFDVAERFGDEGARLLARTGRNPSRLFLTEIDKQKMPLGDFNPNIMRQPMRVVIALVLLSFTVIAVLGLIH